MLNLRLGVLLALASWFVASTSSAQDGTAAVQPSPDSTTGVDAPGSVDVGYRFRSLDGSEDSFRQLFDLSSGPRLLGLDLHGEGGTDARSFAGSFAVTASGLGGDPFPTVQVNVAKARVYQLRVNWRRSRFFDVAPQTPTSIDSFNKKAVTDRHSWTTARQIGNAAWTLDATNRLHFR